MNDDVKKARELVDRVEKEGNPETIVLAKEVLRRIEYLSSVANIDILTGLLTRRGIESWRNYQAIVMCDADNFKNVNDKYGHLMGDDVLRTIAQIIKHNIRKEDAACRYGGDEFLIIFTTNDLDVILDRMEVICDEVKKSINLPNVPVSLSVGICIKENNETINKLIQNADSALYSSKDSGKDCITIYTEKQKTLSIRALN